jgi:hypothetical protein
LLSREGTISPPPNLTTRMDFDFPRVVYLAPRPQGAPALAA